MTKEYSFRSTVVGRAEGIARVRDMPRALGSTQPEIILLCDETDLVKHSDSDYIHVRFAAQLININ